MLIVFCMTLLSFCSLCHFTNEASSALQATRVQTEKKEIEDKSKEKNMWYFYYTKKYHHKGIDSTYTEVSSTSTATSGTEAQTTPIIFTTTIPPTFPETTARKTTGAVETTQSPRTTTTATTRERTTATTTEKSTSVEIPSSTTNSPSTTTVCAPGSQADIVFILDSSGSISASNYQKMLTFVKDVVNNFDVGLDKIRIGTEIFSDSPSIQFYMNKYNDKNQVMEAIRNIPYIGRATNTSLALEEAGSKMFTTAHGDRPGVPNIVIVVTDGWSNYPTATVSAAKELRNKGVTIFAIGVGSGVDQYELRALADTPDNVMQVENFNSLDKIVALFAVKTCAKARRLPLDRQTRRPGAEKTAGDGHS